MELLAKLRPNSDESLEGFLLRLSECNGFESYEAFSYCLWSALIDQDIEAAGAFPRELCLSNIYYADRSSSFRLRAFSLIENLIDLKGQGLMKLALMHSSVKFNGNRAAVFRDSVDIPRCFLRENGIPICPKCLAEAAYVRQRWHFKPYIACHDHKCRLIVECPHCGQRLDYRKTESVSHCSCGYDLCFCEEVIAPESYIQLSDAVSGQSSSHSNLKFAGNDLSSIFGTLLWYFLHHRSEKNDDELSDPDFLAASISYFDEWPGNLYLELDRAVEEAKMHLTQKYNKTAYRSIFGDLIYNSSRLPMQDLGRNTILNAVLNYFRELVIKNPRGKHPNIGDVLLTLDEVSALLSTTYEQVYRLHQEGYLPHSVKLKSLPRLSHGVPLFHLRNVIELKSSNMQSQQDFNQIYLPSW